ncbi:MAG TPA: hypothetical protein VGM81_04190 [Burkholderiaceae bacterium]|jgi:hypothetical protein
MNLLSRLNSQLNQSAHAWRDSVHLPWGSSHAEQEGGFAPSGSLVVAVALASVAAALVMVTG